MKKLLLFILFIFTTLILISCYQRTNNISITCEQIEKAYLEEGYYVFHQEHNEEYNNCYLVIKKNENDTSGTGRFMETETGLKIRQDVGKTAGSYYLMVAVFVWGDGKYS